SRTNVVADSARRADELPPEPSEGVPLPNSFRLRRRVLRRTHGVVLRPLDGDRLHLLGVGPPAVREPLFSAACHLGPPRFPAMSLAPLLRVVARPDVEQVPVGVPQPVDGRATLVVRYSHSALAPTVLRAGRSSTPPGLLSFLSGLRAGLRSPRAAMAALDVLDCAERHAQLRGDLPVRDPLSAHREDRLTP